MRISIAMATYNGEPFIAEQLESFADQTRTPDELVICDDGSTDGTVAIAERFASNAPFPIHVHRNPQNLGYSKNFSQALSRTDGDFVFVSDQDDVWYAMKIERVLAVFAGDPMALAVVNNQLIVDARKDSTGATIFGNVRKAGHPDTYLIAGSCTAIARPLLDVLLPVPDNVPYDSWIGAAADLLGAKRLIEDPLQIYRRHGGNASEPDVVRAPSRWAEMARYSRADPRPAWKAEAEWRATLGERLKRSDKDLRASVPGLHVNRAISANAKRIELIRRRLAVLAQPRLRRGGTVLRAWKNGLYKDFNGIRSALKDLVRA